MALENITETMDLGSTLSAIPGVATVVKLSQIAIIVVIVYVIFLIIRSITDILTSLRFKKLTRNVEEINKKMDLFLGKAKKK